MGAPLAWAICLVSSSFVLCGCQSSSSPKPLPRYIVTAVPLDISGNGVGLCIAIDPVDANGVWWWQPGPSGCTTSILGPVPVMRAEGAQVNAFDNAGSIEVGFKVQLRSLTATGLADYREVKLTVKDDTMQLAGSTARIATERRHDLKIPAAYGR